jgi:hypothetical protein
MREVAPWHDSGTVRHEPVDVVRGAIASAFSCQGAFLHRRAGWAAGGTGRGALFSGCKPLKV